jgi:2-polyprenyl-3-methyl-5-hydroxy-6-metoxy-1,4-benzoquinol methylase
MGKERKFLMLGYTENNNCLVCQEKVDIEYLNLNDQPLANSYHHGENLKKYPLRMKVCSNCWHSQLSVSVDPSEMFEHYLYISDTSKTLTDYFVWAKDYIVNKSELKSGRVLEIACNSGLFLEMFQKDGFGCVGVDPAKNIHELASKRNLNVYVDFWGSRFSNVLKQKEEPFDLILAFNVLAHVSDPNEFIKACKNVLAPGGRIFIQTSQCDMFLNNEIDVIYHEHTSYFTGSSIKKIARNHDMYVSSIVKTDIHGKSFLFSLQNESSDEKELNELMEIESYNNIYTVDKYYSYADKASETKTKLLQGLQEFRDAGYLLVGYGAAAKGNTLLNYIEYKLDYIIDDSEMKWGYLTPGQDIEICSVALLENNIEKICFVPLAWNFYDEIRERICKVRDISNDVFVRYFPEYKVEN